MMKTLRITLAVVIVLLSVIQLASCGVKMTEEEAREIVAPLIEKSYEINEIFFGKGLPHEENIYDEQDEAEKEITGTKRVRYLEVTSEDYHSIDDLKAAAREVYTESYLSAVFQIVFEGLASSNGSVYQYARYITALVGELSIIADAEEQSITVGRTYDTSSLKITKKTSDTVYFTLKSFVDGKEDVEILLSIKDEGKGWRLDSPTY